MPWKPRPRHPQSQFDSKKSNWNSYYCQVSFTWANPQYGFSLNSPQPPPPKAGDHDALLVIPVPTGVIPWGSPCSYPSVASRGHLCPTSLAIVWNWALIRAQKLKHTWINNIWYFNLCVRDYCFLGCLENPNVQLCAWLWFCTSHPVVAMTSAPGLCSQVRHQDSHLLLLHINWCIHRINPFSSALRLCTMGWDAAKHLTEGKRKKPTHQQIYQSEYLV